MAITIVTRAGKGSPLSAVEHDANLTNLKDAIESNTYVTLLGDSVAGRKLKSILLVVSDGTNANTIKCETISQFNGDVLAQSDNIPKGGTVGNFTLSNDGYTLKIEAAGLTGNVVGLLSCSMFRDTAALSPAPVAWISPNNDLAVSFCTIDNVDIDITAIAPGTYMIYWIVYVTDA